jgi:hypothetical protein
MSYTLQAALSITGLAGVGFAVRYLLNRGERE